MAQTPNHRVADLEITWKFRIEKAREWHWHLTGFICYSRRGRFYFVVFPCPLDLIVLIHIQAVVAGT